MTLILEDETKSECAFDKEQTAREVIEAALDYVNCPYEAQINLLLTNNLEIARVNQEFRQINQPTDVLSFPALEFFKAGDFAFLEERPDCFEPESGELLLGDIMLSMDRVRTQSEEYGHSKRREYAFLIAHSMLHLCGYDHMEDQERAEMERRQEEILGLRGYRR